MSIENPKFKRMPQEKKEGNELDNNERSGIFEDFDENDIENEEKVDQDPDFGFIENAKEYWGDLARRIKEFEEGKEN